MNKKDIAIKLLKMQKHLDLQLDSLSHVGCELTIKIDTLDLALDVLGIPEDNTLEVGLFSNKTFCRDKFYDVFYDNDDIEKMIPILERWRDEYGATDKIRS